MKYYFLILALLIPSVLFSEDENKKSIYIPIKINDGPNETLHKKSLYPTIKITCGQEGLGSGCIVRSEKNDNYFKNQYLNVVITANHIIKDGIVIVHVPKYKNWSEIDGFDEYQAIVHSANKEKDLAIILFISPNKLETAELDMDLELFIGTELFKIGYGLGDDVRLDFGCVTSVKTINPPILKNFVRTNAYTVFGDSGGPVFYKNSYKVIAITNAIRGIQGSILFSQSYISPISGLKDWNKSLNNGIKFVFDDKTEIPLTSTYQLWLKDYNITGNRK